MKKNLLIAFCFSLSFGNCFSQTNIAGGAVCGKWTKANSPYLINGAIMIANDSTLVIEPGVEVEFQGNYKFLCLGRILAIGTKSDTIVFTGNISSRWIGISFDNTPSTNDTSKLIYCKLQYVKNVNNNGALGSGALFFNTFSKAVISHCLISKNEGGYGGGVFCRAESNPNISYCTIENNSASEGGGGGIFLSRSSPIIYANTISNNSYTGAAGDPYSGGGGLTIWVEGSPIIKNNIIKNNFSNTFGGGVVCAGYSLGTYPSPIFEYNMIDNNMCAGKGPAKQGGGGVYFWCCSPTISNNVLANNTSDAYTGGGGVFCELSNPIFYSNTIVNNTSKKGGGIYCTYSSSPSFQNTIFWNNTSTSTGQQVYLDDEASDPSFNYCDIEGGSSSFGLMANIFFTGAYSSNMNLDPSFVKPSSGSGTGYDGIAANWSLQSGSSCINMGDSTGTYPATDIAGSARIQQNRIDIGAYEGKYEGSTSTGITELVHQSVIDIFPNPTSSSFTIQHASQQKEDLTIFNILGKLVYKDSWLPAQTHTIVDVSTFPKGLHIIRIGEVVEKIVVE